MAREVARRELGGGNGLRAACKTQELHPAADGPARNNKKAQVTRRGEGTSKVGIGHSWPQRGTRAFLPLDSPMRRISNIACLS